MKSYKQIVEKVNKGGQEKGKIEMSTAKLSTAVKYGEKVFDLNEIPNFEDNFNFAKKQVKLGKTKRSEMPVITSRDVDKFKEHLENGSMNTILDLNFDVGKVNIKMKKVKAKSLIPIQRQLYFDKSMSGIAENGISKTREFLKNKTYFITSSDSNIIDGHHRWLQALLIDPNMGVQTRQIDMSIDKLLVVSKKFGSYIGNAKNK